MTAGIKTSSSAEKELSTLTLPCADDVRPVTDQVTAVIYHKIRLSDDSVNSLKEQSNAISLLIDVAHLPAIE